MNIDLSRIVTAEARAAAALAAAQEGARSRLQAEVGALADAVTGAVPLAEKLSWASKEAAARAIAEGRATDAEVSLVAGEAAVTGEAVEALVTRILANGAAYRALVATLTGLRRSAEAAIAAAPDPARVEAALAVGLAQLAAVGKAAQGG